MEPKKTEKVSFIQRFRGTIASVIAIFTLFGMLFGAFQFVDNTYATDKHMQMVEQKLDVKIIGDRTDRLTDRVWQLEDRRLSVQPGTPMAIELDRQLREARAAKYRSEQELNITIQKYKDAQGAVSK